MNKVHPCQTDKAIFFHKTRNELKVADVYAFQPTIWCCLSSITLAVGKHRYLCNIYLAENDLIWYSTTIVVLAFVKFHDMPGALEE